MTAKGMGIPNTGPVCAIGGHDLDNCVNLLSVVVGLLELELKTQLRNTSHTRLVCVFIR